MDARLDTTLDRSGTSCWVHPEGMLGAMPMPGGQWRLLAYDPAFRQDKPTEEQIVERMRHILPERTHGLGGRLLDASWASLFSVHRRLADTYRQGRILLAGDFAHAHAPFGGQGMLTGIGGLAGERLLHTYEAERRPLATQVLRGSTAATRMNIAAGPVGRFLRDRVMVPAFDLPVLQRWTTYTTSQLWVSYRRGPLGGRGSRPRSGDRIADVACVRADGIRTRLHAELRGRWAVLGETSLFEAARRRLGEHVVHLRPVGPLPAMLDARTPTWPARATPPVGWTEHSLDGPPRTRTPPRPRDRHRHPARRP